MPAVECRVYYGCISNCRCIQYLFDCRQLFHVSFTKCV